MHAAESVSNMCACCRKGSTWFVISVMVSFQYVVFPTRFIYADIRSFWSRGVERAGKSQRISLRFFLFSFSVLLTFPLTTFLRK